MIKLIVPTTERRNASNRKNLIKAMQYGGKVKVISVNTLRRAGKTSAGVYSVTYKRIIKKKKGRKKR